MNPEDRPWLILVCLVPVIYSRRQHNAVSLLKPPTLGPYPASANARQTNDQNVLRSPMAPLDEVVFSLVEATNMRGKQQLTDWQLQRVTDNLRRNQD